MRGKWARLAFGASVLSISAGIAFTVGPADTKIPPLAYRGPVKVADTPTAPITEPAIQSQATAAPVVEQAKPTPIQQARNGFIPVGLDAISNSATGNPSAQRWFEGGDRIKLLVYERLADAELNKYGRNGFSENDFQQRVEMSGEFAVSSEETLSIPMLGTFSVTGSTPQQLEAALSTAYEKIMKRPGFVTITAVTRPPILILGPVKTPGKVDYTPNMTVLHAIALAGGIKSIGGEDEPWQKMESIREKMTYTSARQDLAKLYAQQVVLQAEGDSVPAKPTEELIALVGPAKAKAMIAVEQERRLAIVHARTQQNAGIDQQLAAARQQVATLEKTNFKQYENTVALAQKRVDALGRLVAGGNTTNVQLLAAQSDLEQRKAQYDDVLNRLTQARDTVGRLTADKAQLEKTAQSEVSVQLQAVRQQISASEERSSTSENMLRAMHGPGLLNVGYTADPGDVDKPHWTYTVVRTGARGPVEFPADDLTVLSPGDLVKVTLGIGADVVQHQPLPQKKPGPQEIKINLHEANRE